MNYEQKRWVRSIIRTIIRGEEFPEAGMLRVAAVLGRPGAEYMNYWWPKCGVLADCGVTCRGTPPAPPTPNDTATGGGVVAEGGARAAGGTTGSGVDGEGG